MAGKFEEAKALALVEKYLGSIPKPARKLDATYTEEPPQDGERTVTLRRVGAVGVGGRRLSHARGRSCRLGAAQSPRRHHFPIAERPALQGTGRIEAGHQRNSPARTTPTIPAYSLPRRRARRKSSTRSATLW